MSQTLSIIDLAVTEAGTKKPKPEDWILPGIEQELDDTTADPIHSEGNGTVSPKPARITPPVRRDSLSICISDKRLKMLQQWECVIQEVKDECVACEMHDLTDHTKPIEYAEIYLDEFNEYDRPNLTEGTVFYWSIGRQTSKVGQVRRYSDLRVRRMPKLSQTRKREISQKANQLSELLFRTTD